MDVPWTVLFDDAFAEEFLELPSLVRRELAARVVLLKQLGPHLARP